MAPSTEALAETADSIGPGTEVPIAGVVYITVMLTLLFFVFLMVCFKWFSIIGQKTRNPQQRRMYAGARPRTSLSTHEPTIYVSPSNLPPPPKYECMAPPSYEEVVGVHYPNLAQQPITQPITTALAHSSNSSRTDDFTRINDSAPTTNDSSSSGVTNSNDIVTRPDTVVVTVNERQTALSS